MVTVGVLAVLLPLAMGEDRKIDIVGHPDRFAIPDCVPRAGDEKAREACATITEVLRGDLAFEKVLVSADLYTAIPPLKPGTPNFEDWKSIGAQKLAVTRAEVVGRDLVLEGTVYALETGQQVLARRYPIRADAARVVAHEFYDDMMAALGVRGVGRTKIAFVSDRESVKGKLPTKEVYMMDYDGYNPRRVTLNRGLNILPAWSPDGKKIAYTSYKSGIPEIFIASIYEGKGFQVTQGAQSFAASWSPDGQRLSYYSNKSGNMEIWVSNADGGEARKVTNSEALEAAPTWSPTGLEIAFTSGRLGDPQIYIADAEGLNVRRITTVGRNDAPAWNPSKMFSEIAYSAQIEGGLEVAVVDIATGRVRQITQRQGRCESPTWAPSGRHLAYSCRRDGKWQVVVSDRLGNESRVLAAGEGNNVQPDWSP